MHKPILVKDLSLSFSNKTCFENFTDQIHFGNKIGIIGRNGSGKSSLLKILFKQFISNQIAVEFVPQIIEGNNTSGGEQLMNALNNAFESSPDILLLDEPTNHLDTFNRKALLQKLNNFCGTLIIVSHDKELLQNITNIIWHIDNEKINVFSGFYNDYISALNTKYSTLKLQLDHLKKQKENTHQQLMKEQQRASKSRENGAKNIKHKKWPTVVSNAKASRAQVTSGRKKQAITNAKQSLVEQLNEINLPKIIIPKFSINAKDVGDHNILTISFGKIGYSMQNFLLKDIYFTLNSNERIAITGQNGSGKSTFLKAILNDPKIFKSGDWYVPALDDIGYLDQNYNNLKKCKTVFEAMIETAPTWSIHHIRHHLHDFLFNTNQEVNILIENLSGGECARLSLALIAAKTPKLLILDEITNNLDMETHEHIINVLKNFPGALIIISHDESFLQKININRIYNIDINSTLSYSK
ncbi:MAG: ABC-F family ATP-binding cassette domain-containing protein [Rickettsiales bacterium]|nr:MAG: ABC-F family ATP-binding cassette domain-containing protein [Rickettsiales bacterium]